MLDRAFETLEPLGTPGPLAIRTRWGDGTRFGTARSGGVSGGLGRRAEHGRRTSRAQ